MLNSEVVAAACPGSNHTALFFGMSLEPRGSEIWKDLDAVRDTFRCREPSQKSATAHFARAVAGRLTPLLVSCAAIQTPLLSSEAS
jgi:hypothetical protein